MAMRGRGAAPEEAEPPVEDMVAGGAAAADADAPDADDMVRAAVRSSHARAHAAPAQEGDPGDPSLVVVGRAVPLAHGQAVAPHGSGSPSRSRSGGRSLEMLLQVAPPSLRSPRSSHGALAAAPLHGTNIIRAAVQQFAAMHVPSPNAEYCPICQKVGAPARTCGRA